MTPPATTDIWVCEQHPDMPFQHDDCAGPGVLVQDAIRFLMREIEEARSENWRVPLADGPSSQPEQCWDCVGLVEPVTYDITAVATADSTRLCRLCAERAEDKGYEVDWDAP